LGGAGPGFAPPAVRPHAPPIPGDESTRFRTCDVCGGRAMYLMSTCSGLERAICAKCIDQEASVGMEVHLPCAVVGCRSAPGFILEAQYIHCRPFALCKHHFMSYDGVIVRVFRLPEGIGNERMPSGGPGIHPWGDWAQICGGIVWESGSAGGNGDDQ